jgi:hypothetical protein
MDRARIPMIQHGFSCCFLDSKAESGATWDWQEPIE